MVWYTYRKVPSETSGIIISAQTSQNPSEAVGQRLNHPRTFTMPSPLLQGAELDLERSDRFHGQRHQKA